MTRRQLGRITWLVIAVYAIAIAAGVSLRIIDHGPDWLLYSTFKDLLPLTIAIPAAYLAYSFQRRSSYVQALRGFWSQLIKAVQAARTYTYASPTTHDQYTKALAELSVVIEEARGIFMNLPAKGSKNGWYPFEPIKQIHDDLRDTGYGVGVSEGQLKELRARIQKRWKLVRNQLLREFDRDIPTHHYTWYTSQQGDPSSSGTSVEDRLR